MSSLLNVIRKRFRLCEKYRAEGEPYPFTRAFKTTQNDFIDFSSEQIKEQNRTTKERQTSTERVKAWRLRNAEKNKAQNRRAYLKWKARSADL